VSSVSISVVSVGSSDITTLGFAVKSTGYVSLVDNQLGGSYVNLTTWDGSPRTVYLNSIAVISAHTASITHSDTNASVYLHDNADLTVRNTTFASISIVCCWVFDSATLSASNTTFQNVNILDQSSATMFNVTVRSKASVNGSATLSCSGSQAKPSAIDTLSATSYSPQTASVEIDNCTVTTLEDAYWLLVEVPPDYTPLLLVVYYSSNLSQSTPFYLTLGLPVGIIGVALAIAVFFLAKRR